MDKQLDRYLSSGTELVQEHFTWDLGLLIPGRKGTLPVKVTTYLYDILAPERYVSSVRSIVFKDDSILVISQDNGEYYILPGGRLESGETPLDTLNREILEETGWTIVNPDHIGFMHFHHLGEKPADYRYPFPDFIWPIYISEAVEYKSEMKIYDRWVSGSEFHDIIEVRKLPLTQRELLLLDEALKVRESGV